jgi:hypothetical protein
MCERDNLRLAEKSYVVKNNTKYTTGLLNCHCLMTIVITILAIAISSDYIIIIAMYMHNGLSLAAT